MSNICHLNNQADVQSKVVNVKDLAYTQVDDHLAPPGAVNGLSSSHHAPTESEVDIQSPPNHKPIHPSPLHTAGSTTANAQDDPQVLSLNEPFATASIAATPGTNNSPNFPPHNLVADSSFPFPHFRPLASGMNTPSGGAPARGSDFGYATTPALGGGARGSEYGYGMNIPPMSTSGAVTPALPMSRNVSAASVKEHKESHVPSGKDHHDGPPPAPSSAKVSRTGSSAGKPAMLGAIGEKKSFFQKMFHHDDKKDKHEKSPNGRDKRGASPMPSRSSSGSPPPTPGDMTDSEAASYSGSHPPSRAASLRRRDSGKSDPHEQPPTGRRTSRSGSHGSSGAPKVDPKAVIGTVGKEPIAPGKKEEVVTNTGHKFNLKDLIGMGESSKLGRRPSERGSAKGSDRGSTKGGSEYGDNNSTASLLKKYGICDKAAIGKGATAVVRLAHKWDRREEKLYAVKEFRKRRKNETEKDYVKKLTSEFCISSTLHHTNIVETVDLVQDEQHHWCEVMEYCPGGDLYAAIKKGGMSSGEVECTFKQLLLGIQYLHSMGVAHRDIKPENLLLDGRGHVKITDFGVSDVFRMCWEKKTHLSKGLCGSEPYIAPELFEQKGEQSPYIRGS